MYCLKIFVLRNGSPECVKLPCKCLFVLNEFVLIIVWFNIFNSTLQLSPGSTAGRIYIQDKCQGGLVSNLHGHQEITLNVTNGYKWFQMVTNGYKWLQIVTNGKKVLKKSFAFFWVGGGVSPGGKKISKLWYSKNSSAFVFYVNKRYWNVIYKLHFKINFQC